MLFAGGALAYWILYTGTYTFTNFPVLNAFSMSFVMGCSAVFSDDLKNFEKKNAFVLLIIDVYNRKAKIWKILN